MLDGDLLPLADDHRAALAEAVAALEHPSFAARIADYAGAPVGRVLKMLPRRVDAGLTKVVEQTLLRCLKTAIGTLGNNNTTGRRPATLLSQVAAGVTGGLSGFLGLAALPVELPVTTTLMLRAIADIARDNGEDLSRIEARLACLQVFALGGRADGVRGDIGYFAARALLGRMSGNAAAFLVERGAAELSGPLVNKFMAELVSRFSVVVSERVAASSVPVIGAIGGATVNVIFMNHFQQIAKGHFTVRRLERSYGPEVVRRHYAEIAAGR
jgi:hypothetical protein